MRFLKRQVGAIGIILLFLVVACGDSGKTNQSQAIQAGEAIRLLSEPIDLYALKSFHEAILTRQTQMKDSKWGPTDCRWVSNSNVPGTLLCLSASKKDQNAIFTRASLFSEGSKDWKKGQIIAYTDDIYRRVLDDVWGHDIMGNIIAEFFLQAAQSKDGQYSLTEHEKAFYDHVLAKVESQAQGRPYAVITAISNFSFMKDIPQSNAAAIYLELAKSVVSHETLHAQYFLNEGIRMAVKGFWNDVMTSEQRDEIKAVLGKGYDVSDEYVLLNEFLAFMVQYDPEILEDPWSVSMQDIPSDLLAYVESTAQVDLFEY